MSFKMQADIAALAERCTLLEAQVAELLTWRMEMDPAPQQIAQLDSLAGVRRGPGRPRKVTHETPDAA